MIRRSAPRKKTANQRQLEELDGLLKAILILKRGERCELESHSTCGWRGQGVHAMHILPKGTYKTMRFVEENLLLGCYRHHLEFAHKDPSGFTQWVEAVFPGRMERLRISARMTRKLDLRELKAVLKSVLRQVESLRGAKQ